MGKPVIVEAVRTPTAKNGWLCGLKGNRRRSSIRRAGHRAPASTQPSSTRWIGGCVTQAGEQGSNVTRNAWLGRGRGSLAGSTAGTTVDTQCGSAWQANHFAEGLIAAGGASVTIGCGVEQMSHVPLGV